MRRKRGCKSAIYGDTAAICNSIVFLAELHEVEAVKEVEIHFGQWQSHSSEAQMEIETPRVEREK